VRTTKVGDLDLPVGGLGCQNFGSLNSEEESREIIARALDAGVTFFDIAHEAPVDNPGAGESIVGRALEYHRGDVILATKFGFNYGHPTGRADAAFISECVEGSLRRLRTDRIDLYQIHRPDANTPIGDTLSTLARLVEAGKVCAVGCSKFTGVQLKEALDVADQLGLPRLATVQTEYSALRPDTGEPSGVETLDACRQLGVGFIAHFPLASGLLSGKYRSRQAMPEGTRLTAIPPERWGNRFIIDEHIRTVEGLSDFAAKHGHSLLELALGWVVSQLGVTMALTGASRPDQVTANVAAIEAWPMTPEEIATVNDIVADARSQTGAS
jgi:aryl-alcohol dehydrogenase-like predicted oxidoreductase